MCVSRLLKTGGGVPRRCGWSWSWCGACCADGAGQRARRGSVSDAIYLCLYIHLQCAEIAFGRRRSLWGCASTAPLTSFVTSFVVLLSFLIVPCIPASFSKTKWDFFCFLPPYSPCIQHCCCVWQFLSTFWNCPLFSVLQSVHPKTASTVQRHLECVWGLCMV